MAEKPEAPEADGSALTASTLPALATESYAATTLHPTPAGLAQQPGSGPGGQGWESALVTEAAALLASGRTDVWDVLTRRFESRLIQTALLSTRGRRIEAAQKLGIGRNTITRKIQELHLE